MSQRDTLTLTSSRHTAKVLLADLLAALPAFQTWTGAADSDEALEKIFFHALEFDFPPGAALPERPYAIIATDPDQSQQLTATGAYQHYKTAGGLTVYWEAPVPEELTADTAAALADFESSIGAIEDALLALANSAGTLFISSLEQFAPIRAAFEADPDSDFLATKTGVQYGR